MVLAFGIGEEMNVVVTVAVAGRCCCSCCGLLLKKWCFITNKDVGKYTCCCGGEWNGLAVLIEMVCVCVGRGQFPRRARSGKIIVKNG